LHYVLIEKIKCLLLNNNHIKNEKFNLLNMYIFKYQMLTNEQISAGILVSYKPNTGIFATIDELFDTLEHDKCMIDSINKFKQIQVDYWTSNEPIIIKSLDEICDSIEIIYDNNTRYIVDLQDTENLYTCLNNIDYKNIYMCEIFNKNSKNRTNAYIEYFYHIGSGLKQIRDNLSIYY
jgi:hypothetical protein